MNFKKSNYRTHTKKQPLNAMDERKISSSQTTLTQYHRREYVITESAIRHKMDTTEKVIHSPDDVRRALQRDMQMRSKEADVGRRDRVALDDNKHHYFDEEDFYADFALKTKQKSQNTKKRKYSPSTDEPHKLVSTPSKPTSTASSTAQSLSNEEIITRYNAVFKEDKILKRQYTKACKLARCLSQQLSTIHFATQQPTAQQIQNTKYLHIDGIAEE